MVSSVIYLINHNDKDVDLLTPDYERARNAKNAGKEVFATVFMQQNPLAPTQQLSSWQPMELPTFEEVICAY